MVWAEKLTSDITKTTHIWKAAAITAGLAICTKFIYIYIYIFMYRHKGIKSSEKAHMCPGRGQEQL